MLLNPLVFPHSRPDAYHSFEDEEHYDPDRHLALEFPDQIWTLDEFGYTNEEIDQCASTVAVTSPFRLLSNEGVEVLRSIALRLKSVKSEIAGNRTPSHLAGGVYRSRFLRDFCACPVIAEHMSRIAGTELMPHSMPSQQVYINYAPDDVSKAVDAWHYDGIGFDYVLMLSDPTRFQGGRFEYFRGTKFEIAEKFGLEVTQVRRGVTEDLDEERILDTRFPAAGYAIFQQGNMVIHRAARLLVPAERITLVPGLVSRVLCKPDPTAIHDMEYYEEPGIRAEMARHGAWLARGKLKELIDNQPLCNDNEELLRNLRSAISDVNRVIENLERLSKSRSG